MKTVSLMFGGNIGDTENHFRIAAEMLRANGFSILAQSRIFITPPVDCEPGTPDFLNAALLGVWNNTAGELLALTQQIERASGRPAKHSSRETRTLDIDIITFGDEIISTPDLTIPHPRAQQRLFVLEPLAEIAPQLVFPDSGKNVIQLLQQLRSS